MSALHVSDYPQLLSALAKDEKIVYLCGAGASMSLGSHSLSWPNWILAGRDFLSSADKSELEHRIGSWTMDELIGSATFLLERLEDSYEDFMDKTIGSLHPANQSFEEALQRVWRAGDLITTTNYDLLIEEAVGTGSVSYSSPGEILSIIRGGENKVIHLHGVYDKLHGLDDIIADDPQYKGIITNAGAQFIQNLIGTHPLIIVGCGGTVEDPNLSGFMNFIVDKLGITDVPYFYLMKAGDAVPDLPVNAAVIYYGDEYADLPEFLSELSLLRLRRRAGLRRLVSVNPYAAVTPISTAFGRMHFSNGFNEFVGRDDQIRLLDAFLGSASGFSWWSVIGDGGIGKSRLVLEWLKHTPAHWFGFFSHKNADEVRNFKPFTDTVVVFDYIIGKEYECAKTIEAYLDAFRGSAYKLRILFIERVQQTAESIKEIKQSMDSEARLAFEGADYNDPLRVPELSVDDEVKYIENYLSVYLTIAGTNDFIENCKADIHTTGKTIEDAFRASVEPTCYRPLYLSIFIEVWTGKEGQLSLSSAEDLLGEYLNREEARWKVIFANDALVDSYLRLLAMACAVEHFNITDLYGQNYLEKDCKALTEFFDDRSGKPGAQNLFDDLFVSMDELVEDNGEEDLISDAFFGRKTPAGVMDEEDVKPVLSLDNDDRIAFFAPYIKLRANPEEVYLHMLANVGAADDEELERLDNLQKARVEKVNALPDHAWVIDPVMPDIIKEFIVSYVVNIRDVVRFTKLARANSILGFQNFLALALDDWPNDEKFQKMAVTPPDDVLNYSEYYFSLLARIGVIKDLRAVEQAMIDTDPCFFRYEIELWRRIACVLQERGDIGRLYDSGCRFIEYLKGIGEMRSIKDEAVGVINIYSAGIHNAGEIDKYTDFLHRLDDIEEFLPQNEKTGMVFCENYRMLINLKLFLKETADIGVEWKRIRDTLSRYGCPGEMAKMAMDAAHDYMHTVLRKDNLDELRDLEGYLEGLYSQHHFADIAGTAALATVNVYSITYSRQKKRLSEEYEKLKLYLSEYPGEMRTRSAYITAVQIEYSETAAYRKVPDRIVNTAKEWALQYPDEIEFQEAYFGLLLSRLEYAQDHNMRNEQRRVYKEMKAVAERTDYSAYHEENDMMKTIRDIQLIYGY